MSAEDFKALPALSNGGLVDILSQAFPLSTPTQPHKPLLLPIVFPLCTHRPFFAGSLPLPPLYAATAKAEVTTQDNDVLSITSSLAHSQSIAAC